MKRVVDEAENLKVSRSWLYCFHSSFLYGKHVYQDDYINWNILVSSQVQAAALDEMFHQGEASALRYHKALLLMEGLSMLLTEQEDILSVSKCKSVCQLISQKEGMSALDTSS